MAKMLNTNVYFVANISPTPIPLRIAQRVDFVCVYLQPEPIASAVKKISGISWMK